MKCHLCNVTIYKGFDKGQPIWFDRMKAIKWIDPKGFEKGTEYYHPHKCYLDKPEWVEYI